MAPLILAMSTWGSAATYYVAPNGSDTNPGTSDAPFATLDKGTNVAGAGDVVLVRGGTYLFPKRQVLRGNGTADAWETLKAYPGEKPVIDESAFADTGEPVIGQGSFMKISGLEFRKSHTHGLTLYGVSNYSLSNCTFRDANHAGVFFGYKSFGVAHDLTVTGCEFTGCSRDNDPVGKTTSAWSPAIFTERASDVKILNNNVHGNFGEGISLRMTRNGTIKSNTVWDNYSVNVYLDNAAKVDIDSNFVYGTDNRTFFRDGAPAAGIQVACEKVSDWIPVDGIHVSGNVVSNCKFAFSYGGYGIGGGMRNVVVERNRFLWNSNSLIQIDPDAHHSGIVIEDNLMIQAQDGKWWKKKNLGGVAYRANQYSISPKKPLSQLAPPPGLKPITS